MPTPRSIGRTLAEFFADHIAQARVLQLEQQREAIQTSVWLVTLASGLLTFAAINKQLLSTLSPLSQKWLLGLLMLTILLGALHRFLTFLFGQFTGRHVLELEGRLAAAGLEESMPPQSHYLHSPTEAVDQIRAHFGLDYSFLLEFKVPIEGCRKAYEAQLALWRTGAKDALVGVAELLAAYDAKPAGTAKAWVEQTEADLPAIRRRANRLQVLGGTVGWTFLGTVASFVAALGVIAFALLRSV